MKLKQQKNAVREHYSEIQTYMSGERKELRTANSVDWGWAENH